MIEQSHIDCDACGAPIPVVDYGTSPHLHLCPHCDACLCDSCIKLDPCPCCGEAKE